jgi:TatD DNase family protein
MSQPIIVDSHCHLNYPDFKDDLQQVIANAYEANIGYMQTICTKLPEFPDILKIANSNEKIYCSVGVHPHEVEKHAEITTEELIRLADNPKVIGIGETGLDYFYEHSPRELQKDAFIKHITASRVTGKPIIVHTRDADEDTIEILQNEMQKGKFKGLIHCFSSSRFVAEEAIKMGMYVSISGIVTFKKSIELQNIVKDLPLDKLLVETDAPFLAPVPKRGKRNEPAYTKYTAEFLADLKNTTYEEVAEITTRNFMELFTINPQL